ncbi:hypothetical protein COO60DRAFT_477914 [Scenedesmus sp. NREL 46B-D3]|nr:hypothetical protein COO60DRAFT_477914 [Scenedesmus sp. NREL 46B-D3]
MHLKQPFAAMVVQQALAGPARTCKEVQDDMFQHLRRLKAVVKQALASPASTCRHSQHKICNAIGSCCCRVHIITTV